MCFCIYSDGAISRSRRCVAGIATAALTAPYFFFSWLRPTLKSCPRHLYPSTSQSISLSRLKVGLSACLFKITFDFFKLIFSLRRGFRIHHEAFFSRVLNTHWTRQDIVTVYSNPCRSFFFFHHRDRPAAKIPSRTWLYVQQKKPFIRTFNYIPTFFFQITGRSLQYLVP